MMPGLQWYRGGRTGLQVKDLRLRMSHIPHSGGLVEWREQISRSEHELVREGEMARDGLDS
jgi:hypothetical protein